jgi:hypothetical protein
MQPVTTGVLSAADAGTAADDTEERATTAFAAWEASAQALSHIRLSLEQHDSLYGGHTSPAREQIFAVLERLVQERNLLVFVEFGIDSAIVPQLGVCCARGLFTSAVCYCAACSCPGVGERAGLRCKKVASAGAVVLEGWPAYKRSQCRKMPGGRRC